LLLLGASQGGGVAPAPHAPAAVPAPHEVVDPAGAEALAVVDAAPAAPAAIVQRAAAAPTAPATGLVTLRGRCVGADRQPLAGCVVDFTARAANEQAVQAWLLDHASLPAWQDPAGVQTGPDGRFEFRFEAWPPLQYLLSITRDGAVPMDGRWSSIPASALIDVGDVVLLPGILLTGRVVDGDGRPQADQVLTLSVFVDPLREMLARQSAPTEPPPVRSTWGGAVVTDAAGRFTVRQALAPGDYLVNAGRRQVVPEPRLRVAAEPPQQDVTIVLAVESAARSIRGRVVDERGQPVANAAVIVETRVMERRASAASARDGTFELAAPAGRLEDVVQLRATASGCEPSPLAAVTWGAEGVELRLVRGGVLTVRVVDSESLPVVRYVLRLCSLEQGRTRSSAADVRASGEHEDGVATVAGLTLGPWMLALEFPAESGIEPIVQRFEHAQPGDRRIDVRAVPRAARVVRVVDPTGRPVAGCSVRLVDGCGAALDAHAHALPFATWVFNAANSIPLLLTEGNTGADGACVVRGPVGQDLVLAVAARGHPAMERIVRLDANAELVVQLSRGATLQCRIEPPAALVELRRLAGIDAAAQDPPRELLPTLRLHGGKGRIFPPLFPMTAGHAPLTFSPDGALDVSGLPPGEWQLQVMFRDASDPAAPRTRAWPCTTVALADGEATAVVLDLGDLVPGTIEGQFLLNGEPFAGASVRLERGREQFHVAADAAGRFVFRGPPGEYRVGARRASAPTAPAIGGESVVLVERGGLARRTWSLASATLRIVVRRADGSPAAGVPLRLTPGNVILPWTDAAGVVEVEVGVGSFAIEALPARLHDLREQMRLRREAREAGAGDPIEPHWRRVAEVVVVVGQPQVVELRSTDD
jgi:hypothetical protein